MIPATSSKVVGGCAVGHSQSEAGRTISKAGRMSFGVGIIGLIIRIVIAFWPTRVAAREGHSFVGYFLVSLVIVR